VTRSATARVGREPCDSPGFLLWNAALAWQRSVTAALRPFGLTPVQFVILACVISLEDEGIQPNQLMICARARTGVTMTSQVLTKLVGADLVSRVPNPDDARANVVRVTRRGQDLVDAAAEVVATVDREFFGEHSSQVFALRAFVPGAR
jgi:DNA-binding MarR family transcriptional regulator